MKQKDARVGMGLQLKWAAIGGAVVIGMLTTLGMAHQPAQGPTGPSSAQVNAERQRQALEQLARAEEELASAQVVVDFWEKEMAAQEALMGQYNALAASDEIARTLLERSKQLCFRAGFQAQDAKLKTAQVGHKVQLLRAAIPQ